MIIIVMLKEDTVNENRLYSESEIKKLCLYAHIILTVYLKIKIFISCW